MSTGKSQLYMAVTACCCLLASSAAGFPDVVSLGLGRGYDQGASFQMVITGSSMESARAALEADGVDFTASEGFTSGVIAGYDVVLLGLFDPAETLTNAERNAIEAYVHSGGGLVYLGDNSKFAAPNQSVAGIFGVTFGDDAGTGPATTIPDPAHPIIDGPAGVVTEYDISGNQAGFVGGIVDLGPHARAVLSTDQRTVVAVIEPTVLGPNSGPVVFVAEVNGFADAGLGTIDLADNLTLIRNIFAYVSTGCDEDLDCQDGIFCNGAEQCTDEECLPGAFPCTGGDGCHESTDTCGPCTDDAQCDDQRFCNGLETCDLGSGLCQPGPYPCPVGEGCLEDDQTCGPCASDAECDDGLFCNGSETCDLGSGVCQPAAFPCPAGDACHELTDTCGPCTADSQCDDRVFCNGVETCNVGSGVCEPGDFPCAVGEGCHESTDTCGPCTADPQCDDLIFCNGSETCNVGTGVCEPAGFPCPAGDACHEDLNTCGPCGEDAQCDDGLYCNGAETCEVGSGVCIPGTRPCADGEGCHEDTDTCGPCTADDQCPDMVFCNGVETCDVGTGVCEPGVFPCAPGEACFEDIDECGPCTTNGDCDDGLFCTGTEACEVGTGVCEPGSAPCVAGEACFEDLSTCGPCASNSDCDDGLYCTGVETCDDSTGECQPGVLPCTSGEGCHESSDTCGPCTDDGQCDDLVFCNGVEACGGGGVCQGGDAPCTDDCEHCREEDDSCGWCMFDLDEDGVIGTGDYAFFSGCFGGCYAPDDPCAAANFDGDPGICVGSGDFSGFSGCFGLTCAECAACDPSARPALRGAKALTGTAMKLVASTEPSDKEGLDSLPASDKSFTVGSTFYLEVWARRPSGSVEGICSVYADMDFDPELIKVSKIIPGALLSQLVVDKVVARDGEIHSLGGSTDPGEGGVGLDTKWIKVTTIRLKAKRVGRSEVQLKQADPRLGISMYGQFETIEAEDISYGKLSLVFTRSTGNSGKTMTRG
ncbi:MAG: ThuA domain-containing protein [bacterium]|nr:ThuA domain-containing protein [bacterium]